MRKNNIATKTKDSMVRVRVESSLKNEVADIFKELGLTYSEAISLFLNMVKLNKGLPFEVRIPNNVTLDAMDDAEQGKNVSRYESVGAMFEDSKNW